MPGSNQLFTTDITLTNAAIAPGMNTYLAGQIMPDFPVELKTAKIAAKDLDQDVRRRKDTKRAPGAEANVVDIDLTRPVTYDCNDHALTGYVPDEHLAIANPAILAAIDKVGELGDRLMLDREIELLDLIATNVTQTSSPGVKWDAGAGDPIGDIEAALKTVEEANGVSPNTLAMDKTVIRAIKNNTDFQARARYTGLVGLASTPRILSEILGVSEVLVADITLKNTSQKGQAKVLERIWGGNVLIFYKELPRITTANMGLNLLWNSGDMAGGGNGGLVGGWRVERWREYRRKSMGVMVSRYYDQRFLSAASAYLYTAVLT